MTKTYAKLTEFGTLQMMGRIPNISNPTDAQRAAYAAALKEKRQELYAATTQVRARIGQAEDVDAVEEAIKQADALAAN